MDLQKGEKKDQNQNWEYGGQGERWKGRGKKGRRRGNVYSIIKTIKKESAMDQKYELSKYKKKELEIQTVAILWA